VIIEAQTLIDAIEAGEMTDPGGMTTTQDIADTLGDSYETVEEKLRVMERAGLVESKTFGNDRVWVVPDDDTDSSEEISTDQPISTTTRDPLAT